VSKSLDHGWKAMSQIIVPKVLGTSIMTACGGRTPFHAAFAASGAGKLR
jgi:hypothetical protein